MDQRGTNSNGPPGSSFSNGNQGPDLTVADWYAGSTDPRLLYHWWCM